MNKKQLINQIEDVIDELIPKEEADTLIKNYTKLVQFLDFHKYNIYLQYEVLPIKLIIKHKAFSKKAELYFINNELYFNNSSIDYNEFCEIIEECFLLTN